MGFLDMKGFFEKKGEWCSGFLGNDRHQPSWDSDDESLVRSASAHCSVAREVALPGHLSCDTKSELARCQAERRPPEWPSSLQLIQAYPADGY